MLALVMCLLVLVVAGVVLRDALRDGTAKPATTPHPSGRARRSQRRAARPARRRPLRARPHPRRAPRSVAPAGPRPTDSHPVRSAVTLVVSTAGVGVLLALAIGLLAVGAAFALRGVANG